MRARLLFLLSVLTVTSCNDLPTEQWERLLQKRGKLLEGGAAPYAPTEVERFEREFALLRKSFFRASNQFPFLRSSSIQLELDESEKWADLLLSHISRRKIYLWDVQRRELDTISERLEELRGKQLKGEAREVLTQAEVQLAIAEERWKNHEYLDVTGRIEALLESYTLLEDLINSARQRFRDPVLLQMWEEWVNRSIRKSIVNGTDVLVVVKSDYTAYLFRKGVRIREYPIELGWNWIDDKRVQGDGATPEGEYRVVQKKGAGKTKYYRALLIDYPNTRDRELFRLGKKLGEIGSRSKIGGLIEIHGGGGTGQNWTDGCVALANPDMEDLFQLARPGMPVTIVGAMTR